MYRIWAVAKNTLRQALRLKIATAFIVLLLILLPVLGMSMTGDATLKGRLQTFVSYGLSLTSILLCLLTIVVSTYSLTSDIKHKQIYTVVTKPIHRFQLLLGKMLGVVLLDLSLLILFAAIIYSITFYMPILYDASEDELVEANNEFFTARASLTPPDVNVRPEVYETYKKLRDADQLPEGVPRDRIIAQLTKRKKLEKRAAAPGHVLAWEFENVKLRDPNESLFIRFKYDVAVNPLDLQIYGRWVVGDHQFVRYGEVGDTPIYDRVHKHSVRTSHEIQVPGMVVPDDGSLGVGFLNVPLNDTVVIFPLEDGLEVLYKADTFAANFFRAVLLILFRLVFLACLGMLASTFLSFPVAIMFCLVIFFTATFSGFCLESFDFLSENISDVYSYTIKPLIRLLPQFDKFNPTTFLVPARLLNWSLLAKAAALMLCLKAVLMLLLALLIFKFRELAKIIV